VVSIVISVVMMAASPCDLIEASLIRRELGLVIRLCKSVDALYPLLVLFLKVRGFCWLPVLFTCFPCYKATVNLNVSSFKLPHRSARLDGHTAAAIIAMVGSRIVVMNLMKQWPRIPDLGSSGFSHFTKRLRRTAAKMGC
jgi:hypothetical protein